MNKKTTRIIVLSGPESTGKSSLAKFLANRMDAVLIDEIARNYIEQLKRRYIFDDIERIARMQVSILDEQLAHRPDFIIMDTWLIITKVWFQEVYKKTPTWLEGVIQAYPISLYLLCKPDIPWVFDPVRENPNRREELFGRYLDEIRHFGFSYNLVDGIGNQREEKAIEAVNRFFKLNF